MLNVRTFTKYVKKKLQMILSLIFINYYLIIYKIIEFNKRFYVNYLTLNKKKSLKENQTNFL